MSLIEINPDLRRTVAALERIAATLDAIALAAYGIAPAPPKRKWPEPSVPEDVGYATNDGTLRQELEEIVRPGDVREREGEVVEEEVGNVLDPHRRT